MSTKKGTYTLLLLGWLRSSYEKDPESGLSYAGARYYNPKMGSFNSTDELWHLSPDKTSYHYCSNNPIRFVDPDGRATEPVYDLEGNHLGNTKEGFRGKVIIYSGDRKNFSSMRASDLLAIGSNTTETVSDYDKASCEGALTNEAKSRILTNIVSHFEGLRVNNQPFSLADLEGGKIWIGTGVDAQLGNYNFVTTTTENLHRGRIEASPNIQNYEMTVENIASVIIYHEWYGHIKQKYSENYNNHSSAYKSVMESGFLWYNTTPKFQNHNNFMYQFLLKQKK